MFSFCDLQNFDSLLLLKGKAVIAIYQNIFYFDYHPKFKNISPISSNNCDRILNTTHFKAMLHFFPGSGDIEMGH